MGAICVWDWEEAGSTSKQTAGGTEHLRSFCRFEFNVKYYEPRQIVRYNHHEFLTLSVKIVKQ